MIIEIKVFSSYKYAQGAEIRARQDAHWWAKEVSTFFSGL
jgi:hypothetical protein